MADNSSLLGGMMPTQRRTDIPTLLRGLGAAATGQVPQFRQQMQAEEQRRRQMALQDMQMQDVLAKSAAQDALAIQGFARTGNLQAAADILGDRANLLSNIGADPSSTMRLQEQLMSGGFEAILPQINTTVQNAIQIGLIKGDEFIGVEKGVGMFRTPSGAIRTQRITGIPDRSPEEEREASTEIRKEFNALQPVKDFANRQGALGIIQGSAQEPSPAGDLALIFAYMRMLDPGSVVRESEFQLAASAGSLPQRAQAAYDQIMTGRRLTEQQRQDFINRSRTLYQGAEQQFGRLYDDYKARAERANLNIQDALVDYRTINPIEINEQLEVYNSRPTEIPGITMVDQTPEGMAIYNSLKVGDRYQYVDSATGEIKVTTKTGN
jgi:hypothetical protein